jgi:hypothetical protein
MPIFSEIEEGRDDKKYNSPEIDDMILHDIIVIFLYLSCDQGSMVLGFFSVMQQKLIL